MDRKDYTKYILTHCANASDGDILYLKVKDIPPLVSFGAGIKK